MQAPIQIENHLSANMLELTWNDDTRQVFDSTTLRRQCQCADCKSLRKSTGQISITDKVHILDIRLIGSYAVQFLFSDGHERGIYPWAYLKSMNT